MNLSHNSPDCTGQWGVRNRGGGQLWICDACKAIGYMSETTDTGTTWIGCAPRMMPRLAHFRGEWGSPWPASAGRHQATENVMQITLDIPEQYLVDRSPGEWARHIKLYAAILMFAADELSAGAAAELAGVDRFTFLEACQKHAIPVIDYPPEELRAEVESLRRVV